MTRRLAAWLLLIASCGVLGGSFLVRIARNPKGGVDTTPLRGESPRPYRLAEMESGSEQKFGRQVDGGEGKGEGAERRSILPLSLTLGR